MGDSQGDPKQYLEYLDKEMTIMGILSTFCVAAASLVVDRVCSADKESFFRNLSVHQTTSIFLGSGLLVAAGLCFYLQRSRLAHFYGGIAMSLAHPGNHKWETNSWLKEAYSWNSWLRYRTGFTFLMLATVVYTNAIYRTVNPSGPAIDWLVWILVAAIVFGAICRAVILSTHRYKNEPYKAFTFRRFLRDWRIRGQS
jgi:hypothetical protein